MPRPLHAVAATLALTLLAATALAGNPQIRDQTGSRFPSPGPLEWSNQATVGDIDNDGDLDIIFANGGNFSSPGSNQIQRVYINDGTGVFTDESARLGFSGLCRGVELGDIDDDGDLDAILTQDFNRQAQLFENDGTGNFTNITATQLPANLMSSSRAQFGDIDNDGDLDMYITDGGSNRFGCGQYRVYVNDGDGNFTDETNTRHPIGAVCANMDCVFGDIDNDFDLDVKTASTGTNNSRLYRNDGTGVFFLLAAPSDSSCYSYDFGDMDGDGDLDLVGANGNTGNSDMLMRNNGLGVYTNVSSQIDPNPSLDDNDSKFLNWDDDDDLDLIIGRLGSGGERTYQNDGNGNFTQIFNIIDVVSDSTLDIMIADIDNDGRYDVITAQGESGSFLNRVYRNTGPVDTHAPRMVRTEQHPDTDDTDGPYVVRTLILDDHSSDRNFFDKGVTLHYTVNGGDEQTVDMKHSGGQVYRGEIPGQAGGGEVEYFASAVDWADNVGIGDPRVFNIEGGEVPGDVNGDGVVDVQDLVDVILAWGPCDPPEDCYGDLNGDGVVDVQDLVMVILNWS
jgi:hypothetical protein